MHKTRRVRAGTVAPDSGFVRLMVRQTTHEEEAARYDELGNEDQARALRMCENEARRSPGWLARVWRWLT